MEDKNLEADDGKGKTPDRRWSRRKCEPCGNCGKPGHSSENCWSKGEGIGKKGKGKDKPTSGPTNTSGPKPPCFNCGKLGHFARNCRSATSGQKGAGEGAKSQGQDWPGEDQDALMLGAIYNGKEYPEQLEFLKVIVDSGAAVSALPSDACKQYPLTWHNDKGREYYAANGTRVLDEGRRQPELWTSDGKKRSIAFSVAKVRKPLFSVSKSNDLGNRIAFDANGSYIENKASGEKIDIDREHGVFTMKF